MNNLCIIPARGGSKRIPNKNIKNFLGKPIIAYSIQTAIQSGLFNEVIVSTDSEEIANVAREYGATVPFMRSAENANDFATLSDVVEEVKSSYIKENKEFTHICLLLPTAPFVTSDVLQEGLSLLNNNSVDSVRPVVRFSYPIQRALKKDNEGKVSFMNPEYTTTRSQDLEPAFHDAGMFYFMKWEKALKGENKFSFEIPELTTQDIDTLEDWALAEFKYNYLHKSYE